MKKILLVSLLLPLLATAQVKFPIDSTTHKINYSAVVNAPGTKEVLFGRALDWFALTFKSSNDVIQLKDKETGKIVGKWNIRPFDDRSGYVTCNIIVLLKDNKYKYSITDLYYQGTSEFRPWHLEDDPGMFSVNMTKGSQRKIKSLSDQIIQDAIKSLTESMSQPSKDDF